MQPCIIRAFLGEIRGAVPKKIHSFPFIVENGHFIERLDELNTGILSFENVLDELFVPYVLYIYIYPSVHNQLIQTIFEGQPVPILHIYVFVFVAPWMRWRRWSGRKCARLFIYEPPIQDLCAGFLPSWRETWRSNFGTFFYLPSYNLSVLLQFKSFIMIHLLHTV